MDAVDYLKTLNRICKEKEWGSSCMDCPGVHICGVRIYNATQEEMDKAINAVEEWAKEHPAKTRQSELMKLIPNAKTINGIINVYPCLIDPLYDESPMGECTGSDCDQCRRKYWSEEIE